MNVKPINVDITPFISSVKGKTANLSVKEAGLKELVESRIKEGVKEAFKETFKETVSVLETGIVNSDSLEYNLNEMLTTPCPFEGTFTSESEDGSTPAFIELKNEVSLESDQPRSPQVSPQVSPQGSPQGSPQVKSFTLELYGKMTLFQKINDGVTELTGFKKTLGRIAQYISFISCILIIPFLLMHFIKVKVDFNELTMLKESPPSSQGTQPAATLQEQAASAGTQPVTEDA